MSQAVIADNNFSIAPTLSAIYTKAFLY